MPSREGTAGRIKQRHVTAAYVRNYEAAGLAKPELARYCDGCGRLPAWCECAKRMCIYDGDKSCNHPKREA